MQEIYEAIHFDRVFKAVRKREKAPVWREYYSDGKKKSLIHFAEQTGGKKKCGGTSLQKKKRKKKYV